MTLNNHKRLIKSVNGSEAELCLTVKLMMFIVLTVTVEASQLPDNKTESTNSCSEGVMNLRGKVKERSEGSWEVNMNQTADLR